MIANIKVGETWLVDVRITTDEDGGFEYWVPDTLDNGDTIQQVNIDMGVSEPVEKAAIIVAVAAYLIGAH